MAPGQSSSSWVFGFGSDPRSYFTLQFGGDPHSQHSTCHPNIVTGQQQCSARASLRFKFLDEGGLLPARNPRLFAAVFAVIVASTSLLLLASDLAVQPLIDKVRADLKARNGTDPSSPAGYAGLLEDDALNLVRAGAAYLLLATVVRNAARIVTLFAAVATRSGEQLAFCALLSKARAQLKGPVLTLAFVYALWIAYVGVLAAMAVLLAFLFLKNSVHGWPLLVGTLILVAAFVFLVHFTFLCSLAVVVSVAEPERHGAGAVGRAWRLLKGRRARGTFFVVLVGGLAAAAWQVHRLARTRALTDPALGLLLWFLYAVLMAAVEQFAVCAITAFYYECKQSAEAAATEFVKLATEDLIHA